MVEENMSEEEKVVFRVNERNLSIHSIYNLG